MTPKQFSTTMAPLLAFCGKSLSEAQRDIYYDRLKHIEDAVFKDAVKALIDIETPGGFIPTIQKIKEACRDIIHARNTGAVRVSSAHKHPQEPFKVEDFPPELKEQIAKLKKKMGIK